MKTAFFAFVIFALNNYAWWRVGKSFGWTDGWRQHKALVDPYLKQQKEYIYMLETVINKEKETDDGDWWKNKDAQEPE